MPKDKPWFFEDAVGGKFGGKCAECGIRHHHATTDAWPEHSKRYKNDKLYAEATELKNTTQKHGGPGLTEEQKRRYRKVKKWLKQKKNMARAAMAEAEEDACSEPTTTTFPG